MVFVIPLNIIVVYQSNPVDLVSVIFNVVIILPSILCINFIALNFKIVWQSVFCCCCCFHYLIVCKGERTTVYRY